MKGWTVTVWVDAPDDWNADQVRAEVAKLIRQDRPGWASVLLNTVHTPKPDELEGVNR